MAKALKIQLPEDPMSNFEMRLGNIESSMQHMQVEMAKINTRLDVELPHLATKAELVEFKGILEKIEQSRNTVIVWVVGLFVASEIMNWYHTSTIIPHIAPSVSTQSSSQ